VRAATFAIVSLELLGRARIAPAEGFESSSESVSEDRRIPSALIRIEIVLARFPGAKKIFRSEAGTAHGFLRLSV
jgi:hypothetical protein